MPVEQKTTLKAIESPAQAVEAVQSANEEFIILDLDETLFLRNSTEAYLDAVYPRSLGFFYLLAMKILRPWRWLPAHLREPKLSKDWCFVTVATLLFPWTILVWRWKAKRLAQSYWNQDLVEAIAKNPNAKVIVATLGFSWIVNPLLKHLPAEVESKVEGGAIACSFWKGVGDRAKGKLKMVTESIGENALSQATVVTDSSTDKPLLSAVKTPCLVVWPEAKYVPAMAEFFGAIKKLSSKTKDFK